MCKHVCTLQYNLITSDDIKSCRMIRITCQHTLTYKVLWRMTYQPMQGDMTYCHCDTRMRVQHTPAYRTGPGHGSCRRQIRARALVLAIQFPPPNTPTESQDPRIGNPNQEVTREPMLQAFWIPRSECSSGAPGRSRRRRRVDAKGSRQAVKTETPNRLGLDLSVRTPAET